MPEMTASLCWIWDKSACGEVTWDFPIWEVLASVIVTALVTIVTIRVSVRQARKETDRVLEHERISDRAAAISEVVAAYQRRASVSAMASLEDAATTARYVLGLARIRTSGAPYASAAAEWVETVYFADDFDPDRTLPVDLDDFGNAMFRRSSPSVIAKRLTRWHENPAAEGPRLLDDIEKIKPWFHERMREEVAKEKATQEDEAKGEGV